MTYEELESLKVGDLLEFKATNKLVVITKQPCENWVDMRRLLPAPSEDETVPKWIFVSYWLQNASLIGSR
tara:strand:+ start:1953 stop:2162 length:210 start_codon:yes stop_codon:yes gene_type:complete